MSDRGVSTKSNRRAWLLTAAYEGLFGAALLAIGYRQALLNLTVAGLVSLLSAVIAVLGALRRAPTPYSNEVSVPRRASTMIPYSLAALTAATGLLAMSAILTGR
jgi:hypothetical protein